MNNNINPNYEPGVLADRYFQSKGYGNVITFQDFCSIISDVTERTTYPFIILDKYRKDQLISINTKVQLMCRKNTCNTHFNSSIRKIVDDFLNFKICCPKCKRDFYERLNEEAKKASEESQKYSKCINNADFSENWTDPNIANTYKIVWSESEGKYRMVKRTPDEQSIYESQEKEKISREIEESIGKLTKREILQKKAERGEIGNNYISKSIRKDQEMKKIGGNYKFRTENPSSYLGGSDIYDSSLSDRSAIMNSKGNEFKPIYDNGDERLNDTKIKLTSKASIEYTEQWDSMDREAVDPFHRRNNINRNIYETGYEDGLDTEL